MLWRNLTRCGLFLVTSAMACGAAPTDDGGDDTGTAAQAGSICPAVEPSPGAACEDTLACAYAACGRSNGSIWSCERGAWKQIILPGC